MDVIEMVFVERSPPSGSGCSPAGDQDVSNTDIYRGGPLTPQTPRPPSILSTGSTQSGSSSTPRSFVLRRPLGPISQLLEHAITRWARAWGSTSSLTPESSSSSASSTLTRPKSKSSRRRRRRPSLADIHNARSEREIAARIRAREQSRQIPREFTFCSSPAGGSWKIRPADPGVGGVGGLAHDILRSESLSFVLSKLDSALKRRHNHSHGRGIATSEPTLARSQLGDLDLTSDEPTGHGHDALFRTAAIAISQSPSDPSLRRKGWKGKRKDKAETSFSTRPILGATPGSNIGSTCWWLDVANPTPQDMRAIGKLLQIHPLTLEDILLQEPHEKLEIFPSLGYYFVTFRAIESTRTRERRRFWTHGPDLHPGGVDEGIVGVVNVYLIVFREGICTFHFADISDHTDVVRNRILTLENPVVMSSDWIAHGIMDSIVDAFFPFLEEIEKEVAAIESLIFSGNALAERTSTRTASNPEATPNVNPLFMKQDTIHSLGGRTHFSLPRRPRRFLRFANLVGYLKRMVPWNPRVQDSGLNTTFSTVHRMARTRRLVTSLTRVLAVKSEVITQLRKRLFQAGTPGSGKALGGEFDVVMYMGDVQDHILTLQQSLTHYEQMLSQSHPTYLTELRLAASKAKSRADKSIMYLTVTSMGVLCVQTLIGLHSTNIRIPRNRIPGGPYNVFGVIFALSCLIIAVYAAVVHSWWVKAKRTKNNW